MKNKILFITFLLTSQAAWSMPPTARDAAVKFGLAMVGVILSSLIIYFGLAVYNKIRSNILSELSPEEEVLKTPKTTDDAIKFFIRKNKLK